MECQSYPRFFDVYLDAENTQNGDRTSLLFVFWCGRCEIVDDGQAPEFRLTPGSQASPSRCSTVIPLYSGVEMRKDHVWLLIGVALCFSSCEIPF